MPTAAVVSPGDTINASDHNDLVTDVTNNELPAFKYFVTQVEMSTLNAAASKVGATSSFNCQPGQTSHATDNSTGDYCNVRFNIYVTGTGATVGTYGSDLDFGAGVQFQDTTNQDAFYGTAAFTEAAVVPVNATSTTAHIGFFIADNAMYASNADGTTQTSTNILTIDSNTLYVVRFVFDAGTDIKFYVNEALEATHTTNLPDSGDNLYGFLGITTVENDFKVAYLNNHMWYRTKAGGGA